MAENTVLSLCFPCPTPAQAGPPMDETITNAFQQLCAEVGQSHHCQIILDLCLNNPQAQKRLSIDTHQSAYNVTISGAYQNVMLARGSLMRNNPLKPKLSIKISKSSITVDPFSESSQSSPTTSTPGLSTSDTAPLDLATAPASTGATQSAQASLGTQSSSTTTSNALSNLDTHTRSDSPSCQEDAAASTATAENNNFTPVASIGNDPITQKSIPAQASTAAAFSSYFTVLPQFKNQVDQISISTRTSITLVSSHFHALPVAKSALAAHARQESVELLISGTWENAEAARLQLLVAIETLQPGIVQDKVQVELKYQNMIGGRKRKDIQDLMAQTRTSIYLASPFVQTANKSGSPVDPRNNEIYITGEPANVEKAKDALQKVCARAQAASLQCTRQVNIASRKLDWMLLNYREKLRTIMIDNGAFIAFPPLGASHPVIFIYGESRVNVERTIRTVMQLSSQFHSGSINMLTPARDSLLTVPIKSPNTLSPIANISKIVSQSSGAEIEFRNNGFFIFGNEIQTRLAVQYLTDIDFVKTLHHEVKFSVELANEHREFISGKKNGKINRIMKATGAKIKFDPCNEYNFYVDLSSTIAVKAVEALALLQEELPAEISFYVPETYHKRIIGVGGKNIQRIMKKYGVYVKFSNSEEFANLGGYFDNLDNVVARTPSKNAMNLDNLKHAVMELVNPKDKDFVHHPLMIPKQYHLSLLSDHAKALSELQEATNATVRFPERETGSDTVWISGPETFIQQSTSMLLSLVDEQYVYPVPFSEAMHRVLSKPEFQRDVVDRMKNEWNMTLIPPRVVEISGTSTNEAAAASTSQVGEETSKTDVSGSSGPSAVTAVTDTAVSATSKAVKEEKQGASVTSSETLLDATTDGDELAKSLSSLTDSDDDDDDDDVEDNEEEDHVFVFKYSRNNEDYLQNAKELLVQFLIDSQIEVYDDEIRVQRPRSDSFAEAFPHFNSKILSSVATGELSTPAPTFLNYSLFDHTGNAFDTLSRAPGAPGINGQAAVPGTGTAPGPMVSTDIRALFSRGSSPSLGPISSSPPRWGDQHSRPLGASATATGPSSATMSTSSSSVATGPSFAAPGQGVGNSGNAFGGFASSGPNRLTSLPIDPWASPSKTHQTAHSTVAGGGFASSIGSFRTPPGMTNSGGNNAVGVTELMHGAPGGGYYSPGSRSQQITSSGAMPTSSTTPSSSSSVHIFSPEGPYGSSMGFSLAGSGGTASHLYSSNNSSPIQGVSTNLYGSMVGQSQQSYQQHHQPAPQRPLSVSSAGSRDNLQFLEDKMMSGSAFGPGYGPSLNSGKLRSSHHAMMYLQQQQQQQQPSQQPQAYSGGFHPSLQYPQQRQRHSSHNSNASSSTHHTMFLGPIGGGLGGSAGGSVHSDDISTEDESDEPFDEMRHRYRSYPYSQQQQQQAQYQQPYQQPFLPLGPPSASSGGFGSQRAASAALAQRRGSVPSMGSMYSNQLLYSNNNGSNSSLHSQSPYHPQPQSQPQQQQQQQQQPLSYQPHNYQAFQQQQQQQQQQSVTPPPSMLRMSNSNSDLYGRKSLVNAMTRHSLGPSTAGSMGSGAGAGGPVGVGAGESGGLGKGLGSGMAEGERDLFSSGLGGIIGGGTISHSQSHIGGESIHSGGIGASLGGGGSTGSTLSASALPFFMGHHHATATSAAATSSFDRSGHGPGLGHHLVGGWDR